jgi:hypothetical protein
MPPLSFQSLGIFSQIQLIKLILVICFVGSKRIGLPLTVDWFGTTSIGSERAGDAPPPRGGDAPPPLAGDARRATRGLPPVCPPSAPAAAGAGACPCASHLVSSAPGAGDRGYSRALPSSKKGIGRNWNCNTPARYHRAKKELQLQFLLEQAAMFHQPLPSGAAL